MEASENDGDTMKIGVVIAETGPASTLGSSQVNTEKLLQKNSTKQDRLTGRIFNSSNMITKRAIQKPLLRRLKI